MLGALPMLPAGEEAVRGLMEPLEAPLHCPQGVAELHARCMSPNPSQRPSAAEIAEALHRECGQPLAAPLLAAGPPGPTPLPSIESGTPASLTPNPSYVAAEVSSILADVPWGRSWLQPAGAPRSAVAARTASQSGPTTPPASGLGLAPGPPGKSSSYDSREPSRSTELDGAVSSDAAAAAEEGDIEAQQAQQQIKSLAVQWHEVGQVKSPFEDC
jgi:hypothetical protein